MELFNFVPKLIGSREFFVFEEDLKKIDPSLLTLVDINRQRNSAQQSKKKQTNRNDVFKRNVLTAVDEIISRTKHRMVTTTTKMISELITRQLLLAS